MKLSENTDLHQARLHVLRAYDRLRDTGQWDVLRELEKALARLERVAFTREPERQGDHV